MTASTVYMIHIEPAFRHAGHYVGYTRAADYLDRFADHRAGRGALLCREAVKAGHQLMMARVWHGAPRKFELRLKGRGLRLLCPICVGPAAALRRMTHASP